MSKLKWDQIGEKLAETGDHVFPAGNITIGPVGDGGENKGPRGDKTHGGPFKIQQHNHHGRHEYAQKGQLIRKIEHEQS